jgi:hypothetical protein
MGRSGKAALARAAMSAVEPLVELFLELGITSPEAESLLRSVFVHKARHWLAKSAGAPGSPSDVRVSLVTGVHRNFVRKILEEPPGIAAAREQKGHPPAACSKPGIRIQNISIAVASLGTCRKGSKSPASRHWCSNICLGHHPAWCSPSCIGLVWFSYCPSIACACVIAPSARRVSIREMSVRWAARRASFWRH